MHSFKQKETYLRAIHLKKVLKSMLLNVFILAIPILDT